MVTVQWFTDFHFRHPIPAKMPYSISVELLHRHSILGDDSRESTSVEPVHTVVRRYVDHPDPDCVRLETQDAARGQDRPRDVRPVQSAVEADEGKGAGVIRRSGRPGPIRIAAVPVKEKASRRGEHLEEALPIVLGAQDEAFMPCEHQTVLMRMGGDIGGLVVAVVARIPYEIPVRSQVARENRETGEDERLAPGPDRAEPGGRSLEGAPDHPRKTRPPGLAVIIRAPDPVSCREDERRMG